MITPCGIELKLGQLWEENDSRWPNNKRIVKILGWDEDSQKVFLEGFVKSKAKLSRFHGKNGGYSLKVSK